MERLTWITEGDAAQALVASVVAAAELHDSILVYDRDGKHSAVAIASAAAQALLEKGRNVRVQHYSLDSRPPAKH